MNFKGNSSDKEIIKTRTLYSGLGNYKIVALNPTKKEKEVLKITQRTSEYTEEDQDGNKQIRLDFWLQLTGLPYIVEELEKKSVKLPLQKLSIFLSDRELISQAENKMWINQTGNTTWAKSAEAIKDNSNMDWFDSNDLRPAIAGEVQLTKFLIAILNVDTRADGTICRLDDPKKIAQGKIKELKDILDPWKDNTVQLLLGINDTEKGKFQDFFKDFFGRTSIRTLEAWQNAVKDDRNGLDADRYKNFHVNNLEFSEFKFNTALSFNEENSNTPSTNYNEEDDKIPF